MIENKYYEYDELSAEEKYKLMETFIKFKLGRAHFNSVTILADYVKFENEPEPNGNGASVTIRRSDLQGPEHWAAGSSLTFKEDLNIHLNSTPDVYITPEAYDYVNACKGIYKCKSPNYGNNDLTLKLIELWFNYILPKYGDTYVWLVESNGNHDKEFKSLLRSVTAFVNSTSTKYSKLIDIYNSQANNLMDQIHSVTSQSSSSSNSNTNVSLQNDVPGTENLDGYNFDTSHTSLASKDTNSGSSSGSNTIASSTDTLYAIDKLNNVKQKLTDIYDEWSDEFHKILMGYKPY